jgi:hypothetical protein
MQKSQTYHKRVKQRVFFARLGLAVAIIAGACFLLSLALLLFTDVYPTLLNILVGISQYCISFGIVFAIVFGRLGWSEHAFVDFLLNRASIVFTVLGFILIVIGDIGYHSSTLIWAGCIIGGVGIIFALVGIRIPQNRALQDTIDHQKK